MKQNHLNDNDAQDKSNKYMNVRENFAHSNAPRTIKVRAL